MSANPNPLLIVIQKKSQKPRVELISKSQIQLKVGALKKLQDTFWQSAKSVLANLEFEIHAITKSPVFLAMEQAWKNTF